MEVIRKYENRKLYSSTLKKYVGLDYILDIASSNASSFTVLDSKGNEITVDVLKKALVHSNPSKEMLIKFIKNIKNSWHNALYVR